MGSSPLEKLLMLTSSPNVLVALESNDLSSFITLTLKEHLDIFNWKHFSSSVHRKYLHQSRQDGKCQQGYLWNQATSTSWCHCQDKQNHHSNHVDILLTAHASMKRHLENSIQTLRERQMSPCSHFLRLLNQMFLSKSNP